MCTENQSVCVPIPFHGSILTRKPPRTSLFSTFLKNVRCVSCFLQLHPPSQSLSVSLLHLLLLHPLALPPQFLTLHGYFSFFPIHFRLPTTPKTLEATFLLDNFHHNLSIFVFFFFVFVAKQIAIVVFVFLVGAGIHVYQCNFLHPYFN